MTVASRPLRLPRAAAALALALAALAAVPARARVTIDLAASAPSLRIEGVAANDDFGSSIAAGDVNGDGVADLLVADPYPSGRSGSEAGRVHLFLGGPGFFAQPRRAATSADTIITSSATVIASQQGGIPATGDVDGDGLDDVVIGSPTARLGCPAECGGAWIVLGRPTWPSTLDVETGDAHVTFRGNGLRFGTAALEDVDADGLADALIVQADAPSGQARGRVLVYLARNLTAGEFVDAPREPPELETIGEANNARQVGIRRADLDLDGDLELIVQSGTIGSARGILAGADLPAGTVDLASAAATARLVDPVAANRTSLLARLPVDGPSVSDVTTSSGVGSLGRTANGVVSVGPAPAVAIGASAQMGPAGAAWMVHGPESDANGRGQMVGDVTGDGLPDLAFRLDSDTPRTTPRVYLMSLAAPWSCVPGPRPDVDLAQVGDELAWLPAADGDFFASSILTGDFDGDGLEDVVLSAPDADGAILGGSDGVAIVERGRPDWDADGVANADDCEPFTPGTSVATTPDLRVAAGGTLDWSGTADGWSILSGRLSELHADRGFDRATVEAAGLVTTTWIDPRPAPAADGWWYLVVGDASCGFSDLGASAAAQALESRLCALLP